MVIQSERRGENRMVKRMKTWMLLLIMLLTCHTVFAEHSVAVGDKVTFGTFPQHMKSVNVPAAAEPIVWRVLAVDGSKALLLAEQPLVGMPYNSDDSFLYEVTWETCSLRDWLNGSFLNDAFSREEQQSILQTNISTPDYNQGGFVVSGGNDTQDYVFLLSAEETKAYLATDESRQCCPTDYAVYTGAGKKWGFFNDDSLSVAEYTDNVGVWWLRSPGKIGHYTAHCDWDGSINWSGEYSGGNLDRKTGKPDANSFSVRPAIWVSRDAISAR